MNASTVCFILAAVCFALGFFNFTFTTGTPPNQHTHSYNWISGGLFFITLGLWLSQLLH